MKTCYTCVLVYCVFVYVEVAVAAQRDTVISLIQDLKLHTTDLIILILDQEPGLSLYIQVAEGHHYHYLKCVE